jgi:putative transposase
MRVQQSSKAECKTMIERGDKLSVMWQCHLLKLLRSTDYRWSRPVLTCDLELMRRIDDLPLAYPWMVSRRTIYQPLRAGFPVCRDRVRQLMHGMGNYAVYRWPRTTIPASGHQINVCLLKDMVIVLPNQVWAADSAYLPMAHGVLYLAAIMNLHSHKVLSRRHFNSSTANVRGGALDEALRRIGKPEIFYTDQGSDLTGTECFGRLKGTGIRISMDGKGCWLDNEFIERLWRINYEEVYMRAYDAVAATPSGVGSYLGFYNSGRTQQALGGQSPDEVYFQTNGLMEAA